MFIRLKTNDSNDVNVNINTIKTFAPNSTGNGSVVSFTDGSVISVQDSTRSIRGYVKKALFAIHTGGGSAENESQEG